MGVTVLNSGNSAILYPKNVCRLLNRPSNSGKVRRNALEAPERPQNGLRTSWNPKETSYGTRDVTVTLPSGLSTSVVQQPLKNLRSDEKLQYSNKRP